MDHPYNSTMSQEDFELFQKKKINKTKTVKVDRVVEVTKYVSDETQSYISDILYIGCHTC